MSGAALCSDDPEESVGLDNALSLPRRFIDGPSEETGSDLLATLPAGQAGIFETMQASSHFWC